MSCYVAETEIWKYAELTEIHSGVTMEGTLASTYVLRPSVHTVLYFGVNRVESLS